MALDLGDERQRRLRLRALAVAAGGMALLLGLAWWWKAPAIEDDLEARARSRLVLHTEADPAWGLEVDQLPVVANGRNVAVRGPVGAVEDVVRIRALLDPLHGVRRLDTAGLKVPRPVQADIMVVGEVRRGLFTVGGQLSEEAQREQLLDVLSGAYDEVAADDLAVTGQVPLRGDDDTRLAGFAALAAALAGPDTVAATVSVQDGGLVATAVVRTDEQRRRVEREAERFGAALVVTVVGVDVDQEALDLVVEPGLVLASGQVLTDEQRLAVLRAAEQAVGPAGVEADIVVVGLPPAFDDVDERIDTAMAMLAQLVVADITEALITVTDGEVNVTVAANSIAAADDLRQQLAGASVVLTVEVAANPVLSLADQAEALQAALEDVEARLDTTEEFAPGSDQLLAPARAVLGEAVAASAAHLAPIVRVEVHTDGRGSTAANLDLSQRRAQQVVDYLVELGVERSRLVAVGAGESQRLV
ncbi:MAG: OmpA family protein, partial [Acidimicrobiia bacterium]|nr:OmpA family protein [Acidimicrobiia bacterium]